MHLAVGYGADAGGDSKGREGRLLQLHKAVGNACGSDVESCFLASSGSLNNAGKILVCFCITYKNTAVSQRKGAASDLRKAFQLNPS